MERYHPERELPEDIQALPRGETVCQFCGVSYLVHHEIKRLEEKVQQQNEQLEIVNGKLKQLHAENNLLLKEKQTFEADLASKVEKESTLQSLLDEASVESSSLKKQCDTLKHLMREQEGSLEEQLMQQNNYFIQGLRRVRESSQQLKGLGNDIPQLLLHFSSEYSALLSVVRQKCSAWETQSTSGYASLRLEVTALKQALETEQRYSMSVKQELENHKETACHELEKCRDQVLDLQEQLKATCSRLQHSQVECCNKEEKIKNLSTVLGSLKSQVDELKKEKNDNTKHNHQEMKRLERVLVSTRQEYERAAESNSKAFERRIQDIREKLINKEKELQECIRHGAKQDEELRGMLQALKLKHSSELQKLMEKHQQDLVTERSKSIVEVQKQARNENRNNQAVIAELKSSLAVTQLEHSRVVTALKEELRKEKGMFDQEVSKHIQEMKEMELQLSYEQKAREELRLRQNNEVEQIMKELSSKDVYCANLEEKLTDAYKEITQLQATVERECLEREKRVAEISGQR